MQVDTLSKPILSLMHKTLCRRRVRPPPRRTAGATRRCWQRARGKPSASLPPQGCRPCPSDASGGGATHLWVVSGRLGLGLHAGGQKCYASSNSTRPASGGVWDTGVQTRGGAHSSRQEPGRGRALHSMLGALRRQLSVHTSVFEQSDGMNQVKEAGFLFMCQCQKARRKESAGNFLTPTNQPSESNRCQLHRANCNHKTESLQPTLPAPSADRSTHSNSSTRGHKSLLHAASGKAMYLSAYGNERNDATAVMFPA